MGEGGRSHGAIPDKRGGGRDGAVPRPREGIRGVGEAARGTSNGRGENGARVRKERDVLNDKEVFDQLQLQMMLLEYHSTLASLDLGVMAKINPVKIPFEKPPSPASQAPIWVIGQG